MRLLLILLLLAPAAYAQEAREVLVAGADGVVYRTDDALVFPDRRVGLAGTVLSASGAADGAVGVVLRGGEAYVDVLRFAADGTPLASHRLPFAPDAPRPTLALAPGGRAVVAYPETGDLYLLDDPRAPEAAAPLFADAPPDVERVLLSAYAGDQLAVAGTRAGSRPDAGPDAIRLQLRDAAGRVLWTRPLAEPVLQGLAASTNGRRVAVATLDPFAPGGVVRRTRIYDADGTLMATLDHGFDRADLDGGLFVEKRAVHAYAPHTWTPTFRFEAPAPALLFTDAVRVRGRTAVASAQPLLTDEGFMLAAPRILTLDAEGRLLETTDVSAGPAASFRLAVDRGTLYLLHRQVTPVRL